MQGYTVTELAKLLGIKVNAVRQRIHVAGIEPIVSEYIYPLETLDILKNVQGKGRPPKEKK